MRAAKLTTLLWVLVLSLMTGRTVFAWDLSPALWYARSYCSASNPEYCNLDSNDCANFVSQILTYGCQNLCESPYFGTCSNVIDDDGACAACNGTAQHRTIQWALSLKTHLTARTVYYQMIRNPNISDGHWNAPMNVPSYVGAGDVILFFNQDFSHRHSQFCGDWGSGCSVQLYCHGNYPCGQKTLSQYWALYGPGGSLIDGYFDRFWIWHVIASLGAEEALVTTGGSK
jgi:hypothetical protein